MSNELSTVSAADQIKALTSTRGKYADDSALTVVTKVGDWLPYIQLLGANNDEVKDGKFPMGAFALIENKQKVSIGTSFVALLLGWRPKAMDFSNVQSFFDPKSDSFKSIQHDADHVKDSGKGYGPEFLIWLPEHKKLALFFLGNKTGRNEAPNIIGCLEKGSGQCRIKSTLIKDKRNNRSWHGPKMEAYDLPIDVLPDMELVKAEIEKFNNPPANVTEVAAEGSDRG